MSTISVYIFIFLAMVLGGLLMLVRYLESVGVFFPSRTMAVDPAAADLPLEDVYFNTKDHVRLNAWLLKNPKAKSTLMFAHGNAGNISGRLFKIRFFYDLGLNVLAFDYRGYGCSQGRPSEQGIYLDAQAAYDCLQSRGDIDMDNIILYGASLGGVVAIDLACHRKAALLVVESSITSAHEMAHLLYPFAPLVFLSLKFDSIHKVKTLALPKIFIHSPEDELVPFWMGRKLFEAAAAPKEFLTIHGGHNEASMAMDSDAAGEFIRILKGKDLL